MPKKNHGRSDLLVFALSCGATYLCSSHMRLADRISFSIGIGAMITLFWKIIRGDNGDPGRTRRFPNSKRSYPRNTRDSTIIAIDFQGNTPQNLVYLNSSSEPSENKKNWLKNSQYYPESRNVPTNFNFESNEKSESSNWDKDNKSQYYSNSSNIPTNLYSKPNEEKKRLGDGEDA